MDQSFNLRSGLKITFALLTYLLFVIGCADEGGHDGINGEVNDVRTGESIANATIAIDGQVITTTDTDGKFSIEASSIDQQHIVMIDGKQTAPVMIQSDEYHLREYNAIIGQNITLEITPVSSPVYYYHQPVQINDGIAIGDINDAGFDYQQIFNLMNRLYQGSYNEVHSILVYKSGHLVLEEYFFGNNDTINFENNVTVDSSPAPIQWTRRDPHYVASVNKALTGTLMGIAMDQSGISEETKISGYLPEYSNYFEETNKADIDFGHCLNMVAGFQWDEWSDTDLASMWKSQDFATFVLSRENLGPLAEWRYNSALPNLMIKTLSNLTNQNPRLWAHENFYDKLGISDYRWQYQPDGYPEGSARMFIRPRDMLKVGITYLNNGVWNEEQVIPASWVQSCFEIKQETEFGNYSNYFWHRELGDISYLSADGDGGNYINIFPEQDMVVVFTQGLYLRWPSYVTQAEDMMGNYLLPALE